MQIAWIPMKIDEPAPSQSVRFILHTGLELRGEVVQEGYAYFVDAGSYGRFGFSTVAFWRATDEMT